MEEKIINGVDVAGCEHHLSTGYCQLQMIFQGMVLKLPFGKHLECNLCDKDCYYKQLKRKEQECNRYKQTLSEIQQDLEFATYCESQECGCDDANECLECTKKQILQKISEVDNE